MSNAVPAQDQGPQTCNNWGIEGLDRWRTLAESFPCIVSLVHHQHLPGNYLPRDVDWLCNSRERGVVNLTQRAVLRFLLHIWDHRLFEFGLSEVMAWDGEHQQAFQDWVTGKTVGFPCHYF